MVPNLFCVAEKVLGLCRGPDQSLQHLLIRHLLWICASHHHLVPHTFPPGLQVFHFVFVEGEGFAVLAEVDVLVRLVDEHVKEGPTYTEFLRFIT